MEYEKMNTDSYGEIINGFQTYHQVLEDLINYGGCIIGWTDEGYDHRDILFTWKPNQHGNLQRGLRWTHLFVSIMDHSSMGFLIESDRDNTKENGYIMEKLRLKDNSCDKKICELINGVIHEIDIANQKRGN